MKWLKMASALAGLSPALAVAASMQVVAFADKPFCEKVVELLGDRFVFESSLSRTIEWEAIELKGEGPTARRCSSLDKAIIDLDNDGHKDLVVKATFCMKGGPSDSLYIFPAGSSVLEDASWQDLGPLLATHDKFERTGGVYPLTSLHPQEGQRPPDLSTTFSVMPFLLNGRTYVGLTDGRKEWMVIAKYRGNERFDDLCYLQAAN
ncbi:MAG: hypothetical protein AB7P24_05125 [Nitrospira sp.]